jgi:hypothetical protein
VAQPVPAGPPRGLYDEPRPGAPRTITDDQVEKVVVRTLESTPRGTTHWSTREMAKATGHSHMTRSGGPSLQSSGIVRIDFRPVLYICIYVRSTRTGPALLGSSCFLLYRVDNRIHAYSTRTAPLRTSAEVLAIRARNHDYRRYPGSIRFAGSWSTSKLDFRSSSLHLDRECHLSWPKVHSSPGYPVWITRDRLHRWKSGIVTLVTFFGHFRCP